MGRSPPASLPSLRRKGRRVGRATRIVQPSNPTKPTIPTNRTLRLYPKPSRGPDDPRAPASVYAPLSWLPRVAALGVVIGIGAIAVVLAADSRWLQRHRRARTHRGDPQSRWRLLPNPSCRSGPQSPSPIRGSTCPVGSRCSRPFDVQHQRRRSGRSSTSEDGRCSRREDTGCAFRIASWDTTRRARSR